MNGIIPLHKPKGMTSHDCVSKIRRLLHIKKVGHTGTLDPNVEGVLPICIGEATKIIPFLSNLQKEYIAEVALGTATTTEDADGDIIAQKAVTDPLPHKTIKKVLRTFTGDIIQIPPMYSAVKVAGKRLYEYARQGIEVERPRRKITIFQLESNLGDSPEKASNPFTIQVLCSKGTYIRTLCVDIGEKLGYPAHMASLIRTKSDGFSLEDTVTFSELETNGVQHYLLPISAGLQHLYTVNVDAAAKQKVLQGSKLPITADIPHTDYVKMMYNNELLAIYETHPNDDAIMKPVRVFNMYKRTGDIL